MRLAKPIVSVVASGHPFLGMPTSKDKRRRWFGTFYVIVAAGMVFWGEIVFRSKLNGVTFLVYWTTCFVLTGLAILSAILDIRAVRKEILSRQKDILNKVLNDDGMDDPGSEGR